MTELMKGPETSSTRPYLIRALYEWCTDNGLTPYVAVQVDESVQVPREFVKNNEIVLNVSFDATSSLKLGDQFIEFKARFGGVAREIIVPVERVVAIYARENGQGMAFPTVPAPGTGLTSGSATSSDLVSAPMRSIGPAPAPGGEGKVSPIYLPAPSGFATDGSPDDQPEPPSRPPAGGGRPALKRIK